MPLGLIALLAGMLLALFFCVRRWNQGAFFRYLPPIYGLIVGIMLAIFQRTSATPVVSMLETVAAYAGAGWGFWLAVWIEKRFQ